ncbi:hypothetical protein MtrunA17_Chr3g0114481 [Medicago truncatula]|uniref:Uncharacterized protein n=1 Tax=Medicago truncatula TaxID=3880 RepID=A0A072V9H0_MEDTR|nr:hypothetical protein MTR_3g072215 [Medicago truncatula]RHN68490.1 hypothetical protein MtrunA17_Chr3g0114471 [Medicago truncatula]RHN68491.1 hypothetical protein MtrunA17_Chr3g0114481 [Medicago truncatula]
MNRCFPTGLLSLSPSPVWISDSFPLLLRFDLCDRCLSPPSTMADSRLELQKQRFNDDDYARISENREKIQEKTVEFG